MLRQLAALQKMSEQELKEKWRDLYGTEPPRYKASFLKKRLAYRIQELFFGGLSPMAKNKLAQAAVRAPLCNLGKKNIAVRKTFKKTGFLFPGTRFVREWNGKQYQVTARYRGFEYEGKIYRSLSAVATEITGTRWNGLLFFGLCGTEERSSVADRNC